MVYGDHRHICLLSLLSIFTGIMSDYDYHSGTLHDLQEIGQWNETWSFNTNTNRCLRNARAHRHRFFSAGTTQLLAITVANSEVLKDIGNRTNRWEVYLETSNPIRRRVMMWIVICNEEKQYFSCCLTRDASSLSLLLVSFSSAGLWNKHRWSNRQ